MKTRLCLAVLSVLIVILAIETPLARAGFQDIFDALKKSFGTKELPEEKIVKGLKEALQVGTDAAVKQVSRLNGYYKNPKIRIPLPKQVEKVEKLLRTVGFGRKVDGFEESMNRAAERAAPQAKSLFIEAVKKMSFTDARKILKGRDDEATRYFKSKTYDRLSGMFRPEVHKAMSGVGVTGAFQELDAKVRSIPYADRFSFDLDGYVTERALNGLFLVVAEEELKIRKDPAARVTELLKEVFGNR